MDYHVEYEPHDTVYTLTVYVPPRPLPSWVPNFIDHSNACCYSNRLPHQITNTITVPSRKLSLLGTMMIHFLAQALPVLAASSHVEADSTSSLSAFPCIEETPLPTAPGVSVPTVRSSAPWLNSALLSSLTASSVKNVTTSTCHSTIRTAVGKSSLPTASPALDLSTRNLPQNESSSTSPLVPTSLRMILWTTTPLAGTVTVTVQVLSPLLITCYSPSDPKPECTRGYSTIN